MCEPCDPDTLALPLLAGRWLWSHSWLSELQNSCAVGRMDDLCVVLDFSYIVLWGVGREGNFFSALILPNHPSPHPPRPWKMNAPWRKVVSSDRWSLNVGWPCSGWLWKCKYLCYSLHRGKIVTIFNLSVIIVLNKNQYRKWSFSNGQTF